eukprot:364221-Chlamydomonas_euryale.AAC.7
MRSTSASAVSRTTLRGCLLRCAHGENWGGERRGRGRCTAQAFPPFPIRLSEGVDCAECTVRTGGRGGEEPICLPPIFPGECGEEGVCGAVGTVRGGRRLPPTFPGEEGDKGRLWRCGHGERGEGKVQEVLRSAHWKRMKPIGSV